MAIFDDNKDTADQVTTAIFVDIPRAINTERQAVNTAVTRCQTAITNLQAISTDHAAQIAAIEEGSQEETQWAKLETSINTLVSDIQAYFTVLDSAEV